MVDEKKGDNLVDVSQPAGTRRRWPMALFWLAALVWVAAAIFGFIDAFLDYRHYDVGIELFLIGAVFAFVASVAELAVNGKIMTASAKRSTVAAIVMSSVFMAFMCIAVYLGSRC